MKTLLLSLLICFAGQLLAGEADTTAATPGAESSEYQAEELQDQLKRYLFGAARAGDTDMLQEFINAGYNLNTSDSQGYTALILAAYNGHGRVIEQLLLAGADPCRQDRRGNTAMMGAIFKGEIGIARRLLKADCEVDTRNNAGQTPAMYAALFRRTELLHELRERGADLQAEDRLGNTAESLLQGVISTGPAANQSAELVKRKLSHDTAAPAGMPSHPEKMSF